jgi:hypothetical protein
MRCPSSSDYAATPRRRRRVRTCNSEAVRPIVCSRRRGHVRTCNPEAVRPVMPKLLKTPPPASPPSPPAPLKNLTLARLPTLKPLTTPRRRGRVRTCDFEAVHPVVCCHPRHFEHHTRDGRCRVRTCNPNATPRWFAAARGASSTTCNGAISNVEGLDEGYPCGVEVSRFSNTCPLCFIAGI